LFLPKVAQITKSQLPRPYRLVSELLKEGASHNNRFPGAAQKLDSGVLIANKLANGDLSQLPLRLQGTLL
jgi:hypothetical protein